MRNFLSKQWVGVWLVFISCSLFAEEGKEVADQFDVDGAFRKAGSQLVGTKTPVGSVVWESSPIFHGRSFVFTEVFDLVKNGQICIPTGQKPLANGVPIPKMTAEDQLTVEFDVTLNKSSFATIVVSQNWRDFWKGQIFSATIEKNGNVGITYPGGKKQFDGQDRPWWLRKDQPILMQLIYSAVDNTLSLMLRGLPKDPADPKQMKAIVIVNKLKVPQELFKKITSAGIFINGDTARIDNFQIKIEKAKANPLGINADNNGQLDNGKITVTVEKGQRQTFAGFGANLMGGPEFDKMSDEDHAQLAKALWKDLKFNTLRLWHWTWHNGEKFAPDIKEFRERYVKNKVIAQAQQAGVKTILLTADNFPPAMTFKNEKGQTVIKKEALREYGEILANLVWQAKEKENIEIEYVGLQNEPGAHDPFRPEDFPPAVKYLRKALDAKGLKNVKIVAPESAGVSSSFFTTIELLKADPEAWQAVDVIAAHSYGMVANEQLEKILEESGKKFWMTEASNAPPDDCRAAAIEAGLCMNDLNHMTNRWMWFIGYANHTQNWDTGGTGPRLIQYWVDSEPFRFEILLKYYYFQGLSQTFDVGSKFRKSVSSLEDRMDWKGKTSFPPKITVSAAKNPDGSWGVAALNYTTGPNTPPDVNPGWQWPRRPGFPEKEYEVTVLIEELVRKGELKFRVKECSDKLKNADVEEMVMKDGKMTFKIKPMHLKIFRSITDT